MSLKKVALCGKNTFIFITTTHTQKRRIIYFYAVTNFGCWSILSTRRKNKWERKDNDLFRPHGISIFLKILRCYLLWLKHMFFFFGRSIPLLSDKRWFSFWEIINTDFLLTSNKRCFESIPETKDFNRLRNNLNASKANKKHTNLKHETITIVAYKKARIFIVNFQLIINKFNGKITTFVFFFERINEQKRI